MLAGRRVAIAVIVLAYVALGVGYFRVTKECWERRHASDLEQEVYGAGGAAVDVALWPFLLLVDAAKPSVV